MPIITAPIKASALSGDSTPREARSTLDSSRSRPLLSYSFLLADVGWQNRWVLVALLPQAVNDCGHQAQNAACALKLY
jgi:hypothetical protein